MADKEVYATGGFRYQTRELRAGDPITMTGPHARLYRALGKVSFEKPADAFTISDPPKVSEVKAVKVVAHVKRKAAPKKAPAKRKGKAAK